MKRAHAAIAALACALATPFALAAAPAPPPAAPALLVTRKPESKSYGIELTLFGGYNRQLASGLERSGEISARNGGGAIAGGIVLRSPYFVSPFVDIGYYQLYSSRENVDLGAAGGKTVAASALSTFGFMVGPAVDIWRFRVKAAIGVYNVHVTSTVLGKTTSPDEIDLGYMLAVSGYFLKTPLIQVGAEVRGGIITEADTGFMSFGFTVSGKPISW